MLTMCRFDFCKRHNITALAQGMIELAPPKVIREIAGSLLSSEEGGHQYRSRRGEPEFLSAVQGALKHVYAFAIAVPSPPSRRFAPSHVLVSRAATRRTSLKPPCSPRRA